MPVSTTLPSLVIKVCWRNRDDNKPLHHTTTPCIHRQDNRSVRSSQVLALAFGLQFRLSRPPENRRRQSRQLQRKIAFEPGSSIQQPDRALQQLALRLIFHLLLKVLVLGLGSLLRYHQLVAF